MLQNFTNRAVNVLFVEPSGSTRQVMSEILKSKGFKTVQGVASIQDALAQLETEHIDWVITSLFADQPVNGLQLVNLVVETAHLHHIKCTLLIEESETYCLNKAYALGLLSSHVKPITKESFDAQMSELLKRMEASDWRDAITSAEYLREQLRAASDNDALYELEKTLLDLYPGESKLLLNYAKAQFAIGQQAPAKATLSQARVLDPTLADQIDATLKEMFGAEAPAVQEADAPTINLLGLESAVIVDSDDSIRRAVEDVYKELGIPNVQSFSDGQAAWAWLEQNPEPGIIIMEWRIPKVTAPVLIQRLRHKGYTSAPILVLSSLLKAADMPLVREVSVANIVTKPFERAALLKALVWTIQQERAPSEQQAVEIKIRKLLNSGKKADAAPLIAKYFANKGLAPGRRKYIEAELAYANENYPLARDCSIEGLKISGENILVLNLLGKAFMRLSDHEAALKCFEKAQQLSPLNIERLCMIAEAHTELGDAEKAAAVVNGVSDIDPDSRQADEAKIKNAVISGDLDSAKALMSQMESVGNIVSYMNNKAVALARCGKFEDGIKLYEKTVGSIPEANATLLPIVTYNMALAKVRGGDLDGALAVLESVMKDKATRVYKKALSLHARVKKANESGASVQLHFDDDKGQPGTPSNAERSAAAQPESGSETASSSTSTNKDLHDSMLASVEAARGDICCYMIYNPIKPFDDKALALLKNPLRFKKRVAIEREESLGADRVAKGA